MSSPTTVANYFQVTERRRRRFKPSTQSNLMQAVEGSSFMGHATQGGGKLIGKIKSLLVVIVF